MCKGGYILNSEQRCELLTPPLCSTYAINPGYVIAQLALQAYLLPTGEGCKCDGDTVSIKGKHSAALPCVKSSVLLRDSFIAATTFIPGCLYYKYNQYYKCAQCKENYALKEDLSACFSNVLISNCKQATSTTSCQICTPGFVIVENKCKPPSIAACKTY